MNSLHRFVQAVVLQDPTPATTTLTTPAFPIYTPAHSTTLPLFPSAAIFSPLIHPRNIPAVPADALPTSHLTSQTFLLVVIVSAIFLTIFTGSLIYLLCKQLANRKRDLTLRDKEWLSGEEQRMSASASSDIRGGWEEEESYYHEQSPEGKMKSSSRMNAEQTGLPQIQVDDWTYRNSVGSRTSLYNAQQPPAPHSDYSAPPSPSSSTSSLYLARTVTPATPSSLYAARAIPLARLSHKPSLVFHLPPTRSPSLSRSPSPLSLVCSEDNDAGPSTQQQQQQRDVGWCDLKPSLPAYTIAR